MTLSLWAFIDSSRLTSLGSLINKYAPGSWNGLSIVVGSRADWNIPGETVNLYPFYLNGGAIPNGLIGGYGLDEKAFNIEKVNIGKWFHFVMTVDSTNGRLYLNGKFASSTSWRTPPSAFSNNLSWIIGGRYNRNDPDDRYFKGKLDDIGIWNRALTDQEITQLYQSTQTTSTDQTTLFVADQAVGCNQPVDVPVRVSRFRKMLSAQGTVAWDTKTLRFDSIASYGAASMQLNSANFGLTQTAEGRLFYSWNDASLGGVTLPDSAVLFTMRFTPLVKQAATATVSFPDGPVVTEFLDSTYKTVGVTRRSGNVSLTFKLTDFNPLKDTYGSCGTSLTLDAGKGFLQYEWSNNSRDQTINVTQPGIYRVSVGDANGCTGFDTTRVGFLKADILQPDTSLCKNASLSLSALEQPRARYAWSTGDSVRTITVRPERETRYRLTVADDLATCSDSILVKVSLVDTSLRVQGPLTSCVGNDSLLLRAGTASRYQWLRNGSALASQTNPEYRPDSSGSYRVALRDSIGCIDSSRTVVVTKNPLPKATLALSGDTLFCAGTSRLLTASGGANYRWFRNDTLIAGRTTDTIQATLRGRYTVQATSAQGCTANAPNSVALSDIPKASLDFAIKGICVKAPTEFNNKSAWPERADVKWNWAFGNGRTDTAFSPKFTYDSAGTYRVQLRYQNAACPEHTDSLARQLTVVKDSAYRLNNIIAVKSIAKPVFARDTAKAWLWTPPTGLSDTSAFNPSATLLAAQEYLIKTTLKNGCIVTDTLLVKVAEDTRIHVPKAFTPNGDGQNDRLFPILVGIDELKYFRVYNRWGNLVYETRQAGLLGGWDGTYKGQKQPMETFVWVAEGVDALGKTIKASGNTLLIR